MKTYNPDQPRDPKGTATGGRWTAAQSATFEAALREGAELPPALDPIVERLKKTASRFTDLWMQRTEYTENQAEKLAAKKDKKAAAAAPLLEFAGLLEKIDPTQLQKQVQASNDAYGMQLADFELKSLKEIVGMITQATQKYTTAEILAFEKKRSIYPPGLEYDLEFWRKLL